ncbi:nuclear transport factor 2 family protein [Pedobacter alpinus]|uniref:Nuclear transport factor 2 family protein n=1 Tax=Pedobacter alpinus TaxID=1590643 RepID=A0ABW5TW93_9SPHI
MKALKKVLLLIFTVGIFACNQTKNNLTHILNFDADKEEIEIGNMLDSLNTAAAKADFKSYFNFYADSAVFTGTDATERWNKTEFMNYAKPFFDRGKAWSFTSIQRNIYFDKTGETAWFDKLLNTQMKICRGSGVAVKEGKSWKIKQYIL